MAPPPGAGERGFDKLHNPLGYSLIAICILVFALICYHGARWVRNVSKGDKDYRRSLKAEMLRVEQARADEGRSPS